MISTGYRKRVTVLLFVLLLVRFWLGLVTKYVPEPYLVSNKHASGLSILDDVRLIADHLEIG